MGLHPKADAFRMGDRRAGSKSTAKSEHSFEDRDYSDQAALQEPRPPKNRAFRFGCELIEFSILWYSFCTRIVRHDKTDDRAL